MIAVGTINTYSKRKISKKQKRRASIFESEINAFQENSEKKCLICGKTIIGFCKSHSLPKFVLKCISSDGTIRTGKTFQSDSHIDKQGKKNALIFYNLCKQCDGNFFQEYEHEEFFCQKLSNEAINEIALKNYFRYLYKQQREVLKFEKLLTETRDDAETKQFLENQLYLSKFNVDDTNAKIKKYLKRKHDQNFYVIDEINLDYSTAIAYQGFITLVYGFDGLINDIYKYDETYKIQQLGLCIFPHHTGTKIILFCEDGSTRLKHFYKTFRHLSIEEKMYVINYILLLYEEEWAVDGSVKEKLNKETLQLINQRDTIVQETNNPLSIVENENLVDLARPIFELKTNGNIYNFLSDKR